MITDIATVIWKEGKELLDSQGSLRGGLLFLIITLAVFGIVFPLQEGAAWVSSYLPLINAAWLPFYFLNGLVVDSFAGERERKTLETLMGTRLSDRSILFGKLGAAIGYGWSLTLLAAGLALITVNLTARSNHLLFFAPASAVGILVLSLLGAGLAAASGILISLRAATVRQAYQQLSLASIILPGALVIGFQLLPGIWQDRLAHSLAGASPVQLLFAAAVALALIDLGLIVAAMARFQRARLILD